MAAVNFEDQGAAQSEVRADGSVQAAENFSDILLMETGPFGYTEDRKRGDSHKAHRYEVETFFATTIAALGNFTEWPRQNKVGWLVVEYEMRTEPHSSRYTGTCPLRTALVHRLQRELRLGVCFGTRNAYEFVFGDLAVSVKQFQ